jgi:putative permease
MKTPSIGEQLQRERWIKLTAFAGALLAIGIVIFSIDHMLVSFLMAFVISYLLGPAVTRLERRGLTRLRAVAFIFLLFAAALAVAGYLLAPLLVDQITGIRQKLPTYTAGVNSILFDMQARLEALAGGRLKLDLVARADAVLRSGAEQLVRELPALISGSLTTLLLTPFLAFFMLKDGRDLTRGLIDMVPNSVFELTLNLQHKITEQIGSFIRARLLEALIVGLATWIGLVLIGMPYALLLAVFAAATNLIPYVGPLIGAAPAFIITVINGAGSFEILMVTLVYAVVQILDIVILIPMMVAKIVNLHPVVVVVSLIIGAQLLGVLGMLIAIPVTSALQVTLVAVYDHLLDFRT